MADGEVEPFAPSGTEPRGMTLADLIALVAGFAFAFTVPGDLGESLIKVVRASLIEAAIIRAGEYLSEVNLALVLVVLARRLRYGGALRPAEWLIVVNAAMALHWAIIITGGMDRTHRWLEGLPGVERFRSWYLVGMAGLLAIFAALALLGPAMRRGSAWGRLSYPLLMLLPLFANWGPAILVGHELDVLWEALWPTESYASLWRAAYLGLMQWPEHLLICIPFAATVRGLTRGERRSWTWLGWAGLMVAVGMTVAAALVTWKGIASNRSFANAELATFAIASAWWIAGVGLAWAGLAWASRRRAASRGGAESREA